MRFLTIFKLNFFLCLSVSQFVTVRLISFLLFTTFYFLFGLSFLTITSFAFKVTPQANCIKGSSSHRPHCQGLNKILHFGRIYRNFLSQPETFTAVVSLNWNGDDLIIAFIDFLILAYTTGKHFKKNCCITFWGGVGNIAQNVQITVHLDICKRTCKTF